jgi:hypothetical protein
MVDDDIRDERLSTLLSIEPLDELTRRRLVGTALRASAPRHGRRLAVAAAVAVIVTGGALGYLALQSDNPSTLTASREHPPTSTRAAPAGQAVESDSAAADVSPQQKRSASAFSVTAPPRDAGDFGDLGIRGNLDRLRSAIASPKTYAAQSSSDRITEVMSRLAALPCARELPPGTIRAVATGRFANRDAIVVWTEAADGTHSLDAVVTEPCEVRPLN